MNPLPGGETECLSEEVTPRRARLLQKLVDIATRINSAHDVNSVIRAVTEEARDLIGARQAATSVVLDPKHPRPTHVVANREGDPRGWTSPDAEASGFSAALKETNKPIRLTRAGLDADPRWQSLGRLAGDGPAPNGWLAAPVVVPDTKSMGLIQLWDKAEGEFTDDDEAMLVQLSRLAAVAIGNATTYQKLRGDAERKDDFLAMLAHELRNPLAAIGNAVKLAVASDAKEDTAWSMEVISRQMRHLSRLIDDLMDVSRIARGKIRLRRDVMEATPVLESAAATVRTLVEERKHTLDLAIDRGKLWAKIDPTRLEQVVVNLLNNAAKYSEDGGHILLSARGEANEVVISVKDGGVGIPPGKLSEMFELFAQGDNSPGRTDGGLGVGLALVKKLVEMHGGTVTAESDGPGRGSEFIIRLPAAKEPPAGHPPAGSPNGSVAGGVKILIVDDDVDTARSMERLLGLVGHEVTIAHCGTEAIKAARAFRPGFVLLDIGLPGMSGYEVASELKREECCEQAVFIAVSGYVQEEDRRRSRESGIDHHLTKPLDHEALLSLLSAKANGKPGRVSAR
jgi:signal transduction histidine kinase/ActR/RegA family two-component response regulator